MQLLTIFFNWVQKESLINYAQPSSAKLSQIRKCEEIKDLAIRLIPKNYKFWKHRKSK